VPPSNNHRPQRRLTQAELDAFLEKAADLLAGAVPFAGLSRAGSVAEGCVERLAKVGAITAEDLLESNQVYRLSVMFEACESISQATTASNIGWVLPVVRRTRNEI